MLTSLSIGLIAGPAVSLYGIADRVARHCCRLSTSEPLPPCAPVLDVLLRVVPGRAARRHRDRNADAGDDGADEKTAQRLSAPRVRPTAIGITTGINAGATIF